MCLLCAAGVYARCFSLEILPLHLLVEQEAGAAGRGLLSCLRLLSSVADATGKGFPLLPQV